MKPTALILLCIFSHQMMAEFQQGVIYTRKGESISCLIDVYEKDVIVGNVETLNYKTKNGEFSISLSQVTSVIVNGHEYHTISLSEQGEDLFDEATTLERIVIAKLKQSGTINLYEYYYSGNNKYVNGRTSQAFMKTLHTLPILICEKRVKEVYKSNFRSVVKQILPPNDIEMNLKKYGIESIDQFVFNVNESYPKN